MVALYLKALHIIFVVTWFAGLFYIVRLFIYHTEAEELPEQEKTILQNQYKVMEKRLWYGITWPSLVLTLVFGLWLAEVNNLWVSPWFHAKMGLVVGLITYHLKCGAIYSQLQNNIVNHSSQWLRYWNEGATLFLFSIVFLAILKSSLSLYTALTYMVGLIAVLFLGIYLYKKARK